MSDFERLKALATSDPVAFRRLMEKVNSKIVQPHEAQREVLNSPARFRVMNAGRRTGKTVLAAKIALQKCRPEKKMVWWVAPTYKVVKRGYREVIRQLPDGVLTHEPPPDTNFDAGRAVILRFKNGSRMEFYSAERPEGMLGEGVDFAVLDEAAIMPARIWEQTVFPTLMDHGGGALFISTPRQRNWFYRAWLRGQDKDTPAWASWTFPTSSNPYIDAAEIEELKSSLPRVVFEQEVLAKFIAAGSSVFSFDETALQTDRILDNGMVREDTDSDDDRLVAPRGHCVLGIDLAKTTDFTVIYGARASDRKNVWFERFNSVSWAEQKRRIARAVRTMQKHGATGVTLVMDSTGVGDPIVEDMEALGYDVVPINFTTHKANMVKLLGKDLESNRAFILDEAYVEEFQNYTMNVTPGGRLTYAAPEGEHDDVVSAKMLQHWGLINEGVPEVYTVSENDPSVPSDETDPFAPDVEDEFRDFDEPTDEDDDWADLIDAPAERETMLAAAPRPATRLPTPEELLNNPAAWD